MDDGTTWKSCAVPTGAGELDFRGVQGFDENTALVMAAGPGDRSRIFRTTDGCATWNLVLTNPDRRGFWDAMQFANPGFGTLIGDQVHGYFPVFFTIDGGVTWRRVQEPLIRAVGKKHSLFAASNSALLVSTARKKLYVITGGGTTTFIDVDFNFSAPLVCRNCLSTSYTHPGLALGETAGGFSLASRSEGSHLIVVAVGGDYKTPNKRTGTAATWTADRRGNFHWQSSRVLPGGYRSAVAYDANRNIWIAVGTNGTDFSKDDGLTWQALKPAEGEPPDADQNWNAVSLPFAVGPDGRIGKLTR
jgi:hypothetical protein